MRLDVIGDMATLEKTIASAPSDPAIQAELVVPKALLKVYQKKYEEAAQLIRESPRPQVDIDFGISAPKDYEKAKTHYEAAFPAVAASAAQSPLEWRRHAYLAETYVGLGRNEDAMGEGKRVVELLPESIDAFEGPAPLTVLANVYASLGDAERALPIIEHLLSQKVGIPVRKLDAPDWDRIREDPRFQALIKKYGGKS